MRSPGDILLISCYELGHQPLGVALPLGFLQRAGFEPDAMDIAVDNFDPAKIERARVAERVRAINPGAAVCFYGLYAALNADYLLEHGGDYCIGGEVEAPLVALVEAVESARAGNGNGTAPAVDVEGVLQRGVAASRGCLHLCTHCPIPPVYGGRFFVIPEEIVLEDVRQQVQAGASHITFGDPDFLNGPGHSLSVVRALHAEFPDITFDITTKVEHILKRGSILPELGRLGCLFLISAVESVSDHVLEILEKNHTREEIVEAVQRVRAAGIAPRPTWVAFTPWTTLGDYLDMLAFIEANGLIDHVDPVQYTIRLLIPPGSYLLNRPEMKP